MVNPQQALDVAQNGAIRVGNAYLSSGGPQYAHLASNAWYDGSANWQIPDPARASGLLQFSDNSIVFYQRAAGAGANAWGGGMSISPGGNVQVAGEVRFGQNVGGRLYTCSPGNFVGGREAVLTVADGNGNNNDEIWIGPNTGAYRGHIQLIADQITITAPGGWSTPSDARLKKEIVTIPHVLERLSLVRGVNFRWKDPGVNQRLQAGVIGQEMEKAFPELVVTGPKGLKEVTYVQLTAVLLEAVKELKAENEAQQRQIEELRKRLGQ